MIKLSVNINKIATLRNSRGENSPCVLDFAQASLDAGAHGITVHPRPDERHIRYQDVLDLRAIINLPTEFNIEGYPNGRYLELITQVTPDQATLVPDPPDALTSHAGWNIIQHKEFLTDIIQQLKQSAQRVSLFVDPDLMQIDAAKQVGADRIELYTKPFADAYHSANNQAVYAQYVNAAQHAYEIGLGINAGHDLNLDNLTLMRQLPHLLEVSIGHALVCDALIIGWDKAVKSYCRILNTTDS